MELKPELLQRTESGRKNGIRFPLYEKWSRAREFLYGLKVACVSVASVALGGLLYFVAPQVQDLFLEVSGNPARSLAFLQLLVAGDFISPVFISFIRGDRAVVHAPGSGAEQTNQRLTHPAVAGT